MPQTLLTMTFAAALAGVFPSIASAGLMLCPAGFTSDGTPKVYGGTDTSRSAANACQYQTPPDNSVVANVANVNAAGFFETTTWELAPGGANQQDASALAGLWSIPAADFAQYDYMLTFKSGNGTNLISFLLSGGYVAGGWTSPFTNPPFDTLKPGQTREVSHFTLFRRAGGDDDPPRDIESVPEPASLLLFGAGLGAASLVARRRQRRRAAAQRATSRSTP